ncbi:tetratricopeptide repeat protein [bacterium]|nr:tetratricopeptide repeat protein [bacterium]
MDFVYFPANRKYRNDGAHNDMQDASKAEDHGGKMDNPQTREALRVYEAGDYERAAYLLEEAIRGSDDPAQRERLRLKLASAQDELQRFPQALAVLKDILEENPSSAAAWNNIGVVCRRIGKLDDARKAFEQAYRLDPENADHLVGLGAICLRLSDPGNALEYLQLATELMPGHPVAHANLALTYAVFGRLEEAEESLRLATLYGFEDAETIQQKIDALKLLRESMAEEKKRDPEELDNKDAEETGTAHAAGEVELLLQLEKEMFGLAEKRYGGDLPDDERARLDARMQDLRKSIRLLRRRLGMGEVSDSDVVMGRNYMKEEENGEESGENSA